MAKAEVKIPKAVFTKASEIPVANCSGFGLPDTANAEKALIIPITVPNKATNVPTDAIVANIHIFFSKAGSSKPVVSSTSFWIFITFSSSSKSCDQNLRFIVQNIRYHLPEV